MAMIPHDYALIGASNEDLAAYVGPPSQVERTSLNPLPTLTISVDDTVEGLLETLDAFLAGRGWIRI